MMNSKEYCEKDTREFIRFIQQMDKQQQAGLFLMIQGAEMMKNKTAPHRNSQ